MSAKILIVDDSATIRSMLRDALEDDGHDVSVACDGKEALFRVAESLPDLVLLDVEMPEMNGVDVLFSLKSREETRGISVIMVTAHDRVDNVVGALEIGATDFISKPFSQPVVLARVRNILRIRRRQARAKAGSDAKAQFLANMSHEIRSPMTAILGFTDLLYREGDISRAPRHRIAAIETIKRSGEYLLELINDILDLSKVESGKFEVERIRCSPVEVVADVMSMMRVKADVKGVSLQVAYADSIPETIHTDPMRLRQILINLVSNAIKFTEQGSITLVVRLVCGDHDEPGLQVEITDTGIGMTEEQLRNVFKPFCQAETYTARTYGGTGLGLTISRHLAELLGGSISVTSKPTKGSTFTLSIEIGSLEGVKLLSNVTETALEAQQARHELSLDQMTLDCSVLLAEDGPDNQRLISHILSKAGARITVAGNGQIAVDFALTARAEGEPYDVILMDMQMPVMDGYDATKILRANGYSGPIVALTAHLMSHDQQKCLDAGCDDYTNKPIDRKRLISLVSQYGSEQELHQTADVPMA